VRQCLAGQSGAVLLANDCLVVLRSRDIKREYLLLEKTKRKIKNDLSVRDIVLRSRNIVVRSSDTVRQCLARQASEQKTLSACCKAKCHMKSVF